MKCKISICSLCSVIWTTFAISCDADSDPSSNSASAHLESKSESHAVGEAKFTHSDEGVRLIVSIESAEPGNHGIHIHETGDCSASDASSAGGHWNPDKNKHGDHGSEKEPHLGDLGNIKINRSGVGNLVVSSTQWTIGDGRKTDVIGKALVLHLDEDDFSDPVGNSGGRIACGVIEGN